jgi:hypothetical protein
MTEIDDMDVFDATRALLEDDIDLNDRAAVARAIAVIYSNEPETRERFIDWCIKAARANKAAGGLPRDRFGGFGFVPPEK